MAEFESEQVALVPSVTGHLFCMSVLKCGKTKGPYLRFVQLWPTDQEIHVWHSEQAFLEKAEAKRDTLRFSQIMMVVDS